MKDQVGFQEKMIQMILELVGLGGNRHFRQRRF